jgi:hypothetical protein
MIADYLDQLGRELDFDRSLSRGVRQEVEDHLWEAVAADSSGSPAEAQQRAVANFGDARTIAAQFAVVSLARCSRRAGVTAVLVIAIVYLAMKARFVWSAAVPWASGDEIAALRASVVATDRYAFWLAILVGLGGWIYIRSREIPAGFHPLYRRQLRRFFLLCSLAAAALVVSVVSDGVLMALHWRGTAWSAELAFPILSMALEVACVGILVFYIRGVTLRAASTAALLRT